jgi:hypothetical protein
MRTDIRPSGKLCKPVLHNRTGCKRTCLGDCRADWQGQGSYPGLLSRLQQSTISFGRQAVDCAAGVDT